MMQEMNEKPSACYEYIHRTYGRVFRVGGRVRIVEPGARESGQLGTVRRARIRQHYVHVLLDGGMQVGEWHPYSVEVVTDG